jgi:DNA-binding MarR family transcriptional regulator
MAREEDLQRVEHAVERLARLFQSQKPAARRAALSGVDLTRTAQKLLWHVITEAPIRISDLARDVGMSDAVVSRQVQALEHEGLVERRPSPKDGRVSLVRPTARGRGAGRRLRRAADTIFHEKMTRWSARDLAALAEHIERLVADLGDGDRDRR